MDKNEYIALQILRERANVKRKELHSIRLSFLKKQNSSKPELAQDISAYGFTDTISKIAFACIDKNYNKRELLDWVFEAIDKNNRKKNYFISVDDLSLVSLYKYNLLMDFAIEYFDKTKNFDYRSFIKAIEKPNLISGKLKLKNEEIQNIGETKSFTDEDFKWALKFCGEEFFDVSSAELNTNDFSDLVWEGYSSDGQPVYSKPGSYTYFLQDGKTPAIGRVFRIGKDNEPKEYFEPVGCELAPYEIEKEK